MKTTPLNNNTNSASWIHDHVFLTNFLPLFISFTWKHKVSSVISKPFVFQLMITSSEYPWQLSKFGHFPEIPQKENL